MKQHVKTENDSLKAIMGGVEEIKKAAQQGAFPNGTIPEGEKNSIGTVTKALCSDKALVRAYLEGRRADTRRFDTGEMPGKMLVTGIFLAFSDDKELIKLACVGNTLSEDNEAAFVRLFADDSDTLEKYLKECPEGPTFLDTTFDVAEELGVADLLYKLEDKYASNQEVSAPTFADLLK